MQFNAVGFISEGGVVSSLVAMMLVVMSVLSWYLIITKTLHLMRTKKVSVQYAKQFWQSQSVAQGLQTQSADTPIARLALQAVEAAQHHGEYSSKVLDAMCNQDEFVARSMRRTISEEQARLETGLTALASVGSVAPFVGLFGTVWGIYHALATIGASGQATIDKVAGPVGEALIMTALGLAVAIPAVLAYNALVRTNRVLLAQLETFAHDLHTLLITGRSMNVTSINHAKTAVLKEVSA